MIDERNKRIILAIKKHCDIIYDTINFFGNEYETYVNNYIYQNAILTPVTQIGELVKRISDDFKNEYTSIPWKNIAGMRDIIVHNYETIDKLILWNVANFEIPKIKVFCIDVLR